MCHPGSNAHIHKTLLLVSSVYYIGRVPMFNIRNLIQLSYPTLKPGFIRPRNWNLPIRLPDTFYSRADLSVFFQRWADSCCIKFGSTSWQRPKLTRINSPAARLVHYVELKLLSSWTILRSSFFWCVVTFCSISMSLTAIITSAASCICWWCSAWW